MKLPGRVCLVIQYDTIFLIDPSNSTQQTELVRGDLREYYVGPRCEFSEANDAPGLLPKPEHLNRAQIFAIFTLTTRYEDLVD